MDLPNFETITVKMEPGTQDGDQCEMTYAEKDIDLQNIKEEYLEYAKKIGHTSGKHNL